MDDCSGCSTGIAATTVGCLDQQLLVLNTLLTTSLTAVIFALVAAACKSWKERRRNRQSCQSVLNTSTPEDSKGKGEMVYLKSNSGTGGSYRAWLQNRGVTISPVQRVSMDEGELLVYKHL